MRDMLELMLFRETSKILRPNKLQCFRKNGEEVVTMYYVDDMEKTEYKIMLNESLYFKLTKTIEYQHILENSTNARMDNVWTWRKKKHVSIPKEYLNERVAKQMKM